MIRLHGILCAPTAMLLLLLSACSSDEEPVHIGYVEADWVYIAAPASGRLIELTLQEGDQVEAGMLAFRLDATAEEAALAEAIARVNQAKAEAQNLETGARIPEIRQLQANLREAEARLERARKDRDRILPLVTDGLEPRARADAVQAEFEAAEASVESAQQSIEVASLPARPASQTAADAATVSAEAARAAAAYRLGERSVQVVKAGRIEEVFYRTGEFVMPGAPVISLLPEDGLKTRFFVPEAEMTGLDIGKAVQVRADGLISPVNARITFISHTAEFTPPVIYSRETRGKLVFMVEASLPTDAGLHPGLPVEVDW